MNLAGACATRYGGFFGSVLGRRKARRGQRRRESLEHHYPGSFVACPLLAEQLHGTEEGLTQRREVAKVGLNFVGSMRDEVRWFFWECAGKKKGAKGAKAKGES